MKTSNGLPYRRSVRLPEFDYSGYGPYFITIDSFRKRMTFGDIVNDTMSLSTIGSVIQSEWIRIPTMRPRVELGDFQVMPNLERVEDYIRANVKRWSETRVG